MKFTGKMMNIVIFKKWFMVWRAPLGCTRASSGCTRAPSGCTHAPSGCTREVGRAPDFILRQVRAEG